MSAAIVTPQQKALQAWIKLRAKRTAASLRQAHQARQEDQQVIQLIADLESSNIHRHTSKPDDVPA